MKKEIDIEYKSFKSKIILFFKGFSMGFADIIPGVSGGTIAFISGIYEHLIFAISSFNFKRILYFFLFFFKRSEKYKKEISEIPFVFLIVLLAGIAIGILSMSKIIPFLMEEYPFFTYSLFFGLILFSITIPYKKMEHTFVDYIILFIFSIITFYIVGLTPFKDYKVYLKQNNTSKTLFIDDNGKFEFLLSKEDLEKNTIEITKNNQLVFSVNLQNITQKFTTKNQEETLLLQVKKNNSNLEIKGILSKKNLFEGGTLRYIWIFFIAAVAICAMILPGISGAYILVLFGEYQNILKALNEFDIITIVVFLLGVSTGLLSFVRFLKYLLKHYHSYTMAALTGFLVGSLNKIFPLKYTNDFSVSNISIGVIIAIIGAILLYFLEKLSIIEEDPEPPIEKI